MCRRYNGAPRDAACLLRLLQPTRSRIGTLACCACCSRRGVLVAADALAQGAPASCDTCARDACARTGATELQQSCNRAATELQQIPVREIPVRERGGGNKRCCFTTGALFCYWRAVLLMARCFTTGALFYYWRAVLLLARCFTTGAQRLAVLLVLLLVFLLVPRLAR